MVYFPTWMLDFLWEFHVGKYTVRPMDPMIAIPGEVRRPLNRIWKSVDWISGSHLLRHRCLVVLMKPCIFIMVDVQRIQPTCNLNPYLF